MWKVSPRSSEMKRPAARCWRRNPPDLGGEAAQLTQAFGRHIGAEHHDQGANHTGRRHERLNSFHGDMPAHSFTMSSESVPAVEHMRRRNH